MWVIVWEVHSILPEEDATSTSRTSYSVWCWASLGAVGER